MMQVVPKWRVVVTMPTWKDEEIEHVFWISDNFIGNVLSAVARMQFSADGLTQPVSIRVSQ